MTRSQYIFRAIFRVFCLLALLLILHFLLWLVDPHLANSSFVRDGIPAIAAASVPLIVSSKAQNTTPPVFSFTAVPGGDGPDAKPDSFTITLVSAGSNKFITIKIIRDLTGLGLADSKRLAEGAPHLIKDGVSKSLADELAQRISTAGGEVRILSA